MRQRKVGVTLKHSSASHTCAGFTYIGLLILIAIMGVTLAGIGTVWHTKQQRTKEQQLIFIGNQFSQAISAYYNYQTPDSAVHQFPKKLEDLLLDKRQPNTTRYLRKIFADPITASADWGLIKAADGGIIGVHSLSEMQPIKTDNFGRGNEALAGKKHYSEWQFTYRVNSNMQLAAVALPGNQTPGSPVNPIPVNPVPPAYQVPPVQPLPGDSPTDQRKQHYCQLTFSTDAATCARVGARFGDTAGATCMASARARNAVCMNSDIGTTLPVLDVQYQ